ncbi:hypothetical protein [Rickettsia endosymbiont of Orchestes rusci]|uniref:hypothetical protein n=1 Tax=Rickettsia endosymbiont of Orchestes rusci TaxID=3066250 RepID=UPI00313F25E3
MQQRLPLLSSDDSGSHATMPTHNRNFLVVNYKLMHDLLALINIIYYSRTRF